MPTIQKLFQDALILGGWEDTNNLSYTSAAGWAGWQMLHLTNFSL